jgi:putative FmdB family regulatory protein
MPIYTYRCESCGVQFERHQSFTDQPLTRCPECNKKTLRKVFMPVGIVFKGKGFYATDHRSPSGNNPRSISGGKNGESEGKSSEGEVKPAPAEKPVSSPAKSEE